jgi:DGQHR domain-containing protein
MEILALKEIINSGGKNYPMYIAFIEASKILDISIVPNFKIDDSEETLASNLKVTPVKRWQRPLNEEKMKNIISTFNDSGEFMPNPVLLSQNPYNRSIKIEPEPKVIGGQTSEMWLINIPEGEKILWIIDGQHRINGLGHKSCKQKMNHVPVVLLLNENDSYSPTDFAKIFAQVTTTATELDSLHKEWMEYAFGMSFYRDTQRKDSMKTIIELCANSDFTDKGVNYKNPFYDEIIFNDAHIKDNMNLNCKVFAELVFENYYNKKANFFHLPADKLADLIAKGIFELKKVVTNPENSVFFGENSNKRHVIMLKAIIKGILSYSLNYCDPMNPNTIPSLEDWNNIFKNLNINRTNWDWSSRTTSSEGWFKKSEQLASVVMIEAFKKLVIPDGCTDFESSICLGNNRYVTFEFETPSGTITQSINGSTRTIISHPGMTNMKIIDKSFNNEHISIIDEKSRAVHPEKFNIDYARKNKGNGIDLPVIRETNKKRLVTYHSTKKFNLEISSTLYGGQLDNCIIEFNI